jgi:hypothetical protein
MKPETERWWRDLARRIEAAEAEGLEVVCGPVASCLHAPGEGWAVRVSAWWPPRPGTTQVSCFSGEAGDRGAQPDPP